MDLPAPLLRSILSAEFLHWVWVVVVVCLLVCEILGGCWFGVVFPHLPDPRAAGSSCPISLLVTTGPGLQPATAPSVIATPAAFPLQEKHVKSARGVQQQFC